MIKTILIVGLAWLCINFIAAKLLDLLWAKFPQRMLKLHDKISPNQKATLEKQYEQMYKDGLKKGFDFAYFSMNEVVQKAFALYSKQSDEAYNTFKCIMISSDKLLKEFYPDVDFGDNTSAKAFEKLENDSPFHNTPKGGKGTNLPN